MEKAAKPGPPLPVVTKRLTKAVSLLGGPAQAHRRTVQMGRFQMTCKFVIEDGARVQEMADAGLLTEEQATAIFGVREKLMDLRDGREDWLAESQAGPREFLWSEALEDDEWETVRLAARRTHTILDLPPDPLER